MLTFYLICVQTGMLLKSGAQVTRLEKSWLGKTLTRGQKSSHLKTQPPCQMIYSEPQQLMGQMYFMRRRLKIQAAIESAKLGHVAINVTKLGCQTCVSGLLQGFCVIEKIILEHLEKAGHVSIS